jgi:hypothetical protein
MGMSMVEVRIVRVSVDQSRVMMHVDMRLRWRAGHMAVLVMLVMHMDVLMLHRLMHVLMQMPLCQMQPEADGH